MSEQTMTWERADTAVIDEDAYYIVQHNGHEWRDFDLAVLSGMLVTKYLGPTWVRGRPEWIAKIVRPIAHPLPSPEQGGTDD